MNIVVDLNIKASDFFNVIVESIKQDTSAETEVVKGLTYSKKIPTMISGNVTAKVTITDFVQDKCYNVEYVTSRSTVTTTYLIEEENNGIQVFYEETEIFVKKMDSWNSKFMKKIYEKIKKKQLIMKLKSLETYVKGA